MIFKFIKTRRRLCLVSIIFVCLMQGNSLFASKQPIIRVLISKNKTIRIRSDKSLPLIISGGRFSNKKIRGLTLKSNNTKKILFFDENKKNIYSLKNKQKFQVKSADKRGSWVGQKIYSGKLNLYVINSDILVINVIGIDQYLSSVVGSEMPTKWTLEALKAQKPFGGKEDEIIKINSTLMIKLNPFAVIFT